MSKTCVRSYNHTFNTLTDVKSNFLGTILLEYRRVAGIMMSKQIEHFFRYGKIDITAKLFYGNIESFFSGSYKDVRCKRKNADTTDIKLQNNRKLYDQNE